jgi:hypothetical protein
MTSQTNTYSRARSAPVHTRRGLYLVSLTLPLAFTGHNPPFLVGQQGDRTSPLFSKVFARAQPHALHHIRLY